MENGKADNTADELEVVQMFGIDAGVRIYLKGVIVVSRVFEEAVEGIKHLVGEQEEEFTTRRLAQKSHWVML